MQPTDAARQQVYVYASPQLSAVAGSVVSSRMGGCGWGSSVEIKRMPVPRAWPPLSLCPWCEEAGEVDDRALQALRA